MTKKRESSHNRPNDLPMSKGTGNFVTPLVRHDGLDLPCSFFLRTTSSLSIFSLAREASNIQALEYSLPNCMK